jgi:hypothetical protein
MHRIAAKMSPAMVVALFALVLAIAGGALADPVATVSRLLTGKQVKNNSLTSADIRNKSLRLIDFRSAERRKLVGAQGPTGPIGPIGPAGAKGEPGVAGSFAGALESGKTLRGTFGVATSGGCTPDVECIGIEGITFGSALNSAPTVHVKLVSDQAPAGCPGSADDPQAQPGQLCIYEGAQENRDVLALTNPVGGVDGTASRFGVDVFTRPTDTTERAISEGTWAVTAP